MYQWNFALHELYNFGVCRKHNSLPLGPIQPSSPSSKEIHAGIRERGRQIEREMGEIERERDESRTL